MLRLYYNFALYIYKEIGREIESDVVEIESEIDLSLFPGLHAQAENSIKPMSLYICLQCTTIFKNTKAG